MFWIKKLPYLNSLRIKGNIDYTRFQNIWDKINPLYDNKLKAPAFTCIFIPYIDIYQEQKSFTI